MIALLTLVLSVGLTPQENPAANAVSPEIDAILTQLEKKGDEIQDLRCKLEYRIDDRINLDELTKYGTILFKRAQPHDMFLIHFHKLVQDDVPTEMKEWYLFKNRWFWEAKQRSASIIKREIVAPGDKVDLFDVETAPFPVPFGQKKDHILKNFMVSLPPPAKGDPDNTDHLACVPKPQTPLAKDFAKLEFYVSRETHLPMKIVATELDGKKVTTATFADVVLSAGLTDKDFGEPPEWKKYSVVEEPLPKPQVPPGG
ncbi:MAG: hypothetical protein V2A79_12695 [Planctomycetota bacterium]